LEKTKIVEEELFNLNQPKQPNQSVDTCQVVQHNKQKKAKDEDDL